MSDRTRKIYLPVLIIVFGAAVAYTLYVSYPDAERVQPQPFKPLVRYETVQKSTEKILLHSQGTVQARTTGTLFPQVSGQVIATSPKFASGGFFKKGETMLRIDPVDYQLSKIRAELQVAQAELVLAREQEEAEIARKEWEKIGQGEATALVLREPQVRQASASLAAAQATVEQAAVNLRRTEIKAPYDCRVKRKQVDVGQVISPSVPLAEIYAVDYAEIRLPLTNEELAFIDIPYVYHGTAKGNEPVVRVQANIAGKAYRWDGFLVRLEGEIDPMNRMIHGVANIDDPFEASSERPPLSVGMFVTAEIEGRTYNDVFAMDRAVLRGENTVWVIDDANKLCFRTVEVLRADREKVIIKSGIEENEKLCLTVLDAVVDSMEVRTEQ